ncbi:GGDEF domain-containing protein [Thauera linaloolentis]|uniref:diguanylate cyclase n=1 Tax=Thauera linaloolentis (strain DSM 12138 / JCM 21573 / CCUG 41526 / CIP 105981 / IAM 15112 / NBRC 102519 / 47Lol) TaxID=1123367 RepID=N6Z5Q9_THAL4|nr:sensor domain-containing diguanylate cyclase [Thauera linaloolentis]ENO89867.1 diguanylate cyclase [Thauera linaloolentis 47Lol = DSM 12138]MCM8564586.1 diguanylate cyclase [Thauera linaloolentis]
MPPIAPTVTLGAVVVWLGLVAGLGWWTSQRIVAAELSDLAAHAEYEAETTARVVDRLFTEMLSVANMVARQGQVIQLATRYRTDPPDAAGLTRQQRAARFTRDPLVRTVGDFMNALSGDLSYARIYMNNLSDDTVTASNWAEPDSIVGMIYSGRPYLIDALRSGNGHSFGIARLNRTPSYFVASRIEDADGVPQGSVTVKFDAPEMARYLTGRHITLIVNRQGRVTTSSSPPFMLRNVAALLPPGAVWPSDGDEGPGEPMDIRVLADPDGAGPWLIDGQPHLLQRQPLSNTQYQLLTLAALDHLQPMRKQHLGMALLAAAVGLVVILLSGHAAGQMMRRRQDERHAANHDALTGLPNRRAVLTELSRLFALAKRTRQWVLVAFIDLDGFKAINDTYGHEVGDEFLIEAGRRMSAGLRAGDMLGRLGGDEFVVIGLVAEPQADDPDAAVDAMRDRLAPLLTGTYAFDECSFDYLGASFGIVTLDPSVTSPQTALKDADRLMYADKQARRAQQAG